MKEQYFTQKNINSKSKAILNDLDRIGKKKIIVFNPKKSALLVLDMQEYFLNSKSHAFVPASVIVLPYIKKLINIFDYNGLDIVFTKHINTRKNAQMMGQWWSEIITEKNKLSRIHRGIVKENSIIIKKSQYDAFYKTNMNELLKERNIEQLVVTGVMTHLCCETTIRSAFVRNYQCFFPVDGTATYNYKFHKASFLNLSHGFAVPILVEDILNQFKNQI